MIALRILTVLSVLFACSASAQDTRFTYLGVLDDGLAVGGEMYDFEVRLFDDPGLGGVEQGTVNVINGVLPQGGVFSLELDFGSNAFDGERWLEIAVSEAGMNAFEVLSPRQRIAAVPRSMSADNAPWSGLSGVPSDLNDGDDDLLASLGAGCGDTQVPVFSAVGGTWSCGDAPEGPQGPQGPQGDEGPQGPPGRQGEPGPIGDLSCSSGQIARFDGSSWVCANEGDTQPLPACSGSAKDLAGATPIDAGSSHKGIPTPTILGFTVALDGPQSAGPADDAPWTSLSGGKWPLPRYRLCDSGGTVAWEYLGPLDSEPVELTGQLDCDTGAKATVGLSPCRSNNFRIDIQNAPAVGAAVGGVSISDLVWGDLGREPVIVGLSLLPSLSQTAQGELLVWIDNIAVRGINDARNIVLEVLDRDGAAATTYSLLGCTATRFDPEFDGSLNFELEVICMPPDIVHVMPMLMSWRFAAPPTGNTLTLEFIDVNEQAVLGYDFLDVRPLRYRFPKFDIAEDVPAGFGVSIGFFSRRAATP